MAPRRARLNRELVLRVAMELADEHGLEAMTMQRLGERLGVEAMSLYRHVRNKEDLIDGMVDLVFAEIELPDPSVDWQVAMRRRARSAREVLARHDWAVGLMDSRRDPGPANLRHHDVTVGVLLAAGFSSAMATRAYALLDNYIYGFALQERGVLVATPQEMQDVGAEIVDRVAADEYPHLKQVGIDLIETRFDYGSEFDFGLDLILEGLARMPKS